MEKLTLEEKIKIFLQIGNGYGKGFGYGYGSGSGYGSGDGKGFGDGSGSGYGDGYGNGSGSGSGYGDGYGKGFGYGSGDGYGDGYGKGSGDDVKSIKLSGKKYKGYSIDSVWTFVEDVDLRRNILSGFILNPNMTTEDCFVVKENDKLAHGKNLHEAYSALQEKLYDDSTEEERIEAFKAEFPDFDKAYPNADLFKWHHILTGSCLYGREQFVKSHSIDMQGSMTISRFIELTENDYGEEIIKRLK